MEDSCETVYDPARYVVRSIDCDVCLVGIELPFDESSSCDGFRFVRCEQWREQARREWDVFPHASWWMGVPTPQSDRATTKQLEELSAGRPAEAPPSLWLWSEEPQSVSFYAGALYDQPIESAVVLRVGARWFAGERLALVESTRWAPINSLRATTTSASPVRWATSMENVQSELGLADPRDWGFGLVY